MTLLDPKDMNQRLSGTQQPSQSVSPHLPLAPSHPCLPMYLLSIPNISLHGAAYANFVSHMGMPLPPSLKVKTGCLSQPDYSLVFSTSYKAQLAKISPPIAYAFILPHYTSRVTVLILSDLFLSVLTPVDLLSTVLSFTGSRSVNYLSCLSLCA